MKGWGLDLETITRLYRSMFIYTVGFHKMLEEILAMVEDKDALLTKYWKVYTILL
jgi:hypothetical protein